METEAILNTEMHVYAKIFSDDGENISRVNGIIPVNTRRQGGRESICEWN